MYSKEVRAVMVAEAVVKKWAGNTFPKLRLIKAKLNEASQRADLDQRLVRRAAVSYIITARRRSRYWTKFPFTEEQLLHLCA